MNVSISLLFKYSIIFEYYSNIFEYFIRLSNMNFFFYSNSEYEKKYSNIEYLLHWLGPVVNLKRSLAISFVMQLGNDHLETGSCDWLPPCD
jgi:hypothetical protein